MKKSNLLVCLLTICATLCLVKCGKFDPTWESLDTRRLPEWYDDAKVGIFIHWGVFAVPSFTEWFWWQWKGPDAQAELVQFMRKNYPPDFSYADFGHLFKAELYDPAKWAAIFKSAGARYVVLTSKHHEGFTLWHSNSSWNWNSVDTGPHRDLIGPLAEAVRGKGLKFGLYHSKFEWFNPTYLQDKANGFSTQKFVDEKTLPELYDIVHKFKPEIIWSDGDWDADDVYWKSKEFLAWLYNESPVKDSVVVNDRWGRGCYCLHGDFINCADRYRPGKLQIKKWENAMTIDRHSWGYRRPSQLTDYYSDRELLHEVIETVAFGGNILINVGPTADGRISPIFEERLNNLGHWLSINGQAIYETRAWEVSQNDTKTRNLYYTKSKSAGVVYGIFEDWPASNELLLYSLNSTLTTPDTRGELLTSTGSIPVSCLTATEHFVKVCLSDVPVKEFKNEAWVIKFSGIKS